MDDRQPASHALPIWADGGKLEMVPENIHHVTGVMVRLTHLLSHQR